MKHIRYVSILRVCVSDMQRKNLQQADMTLTREKFAAAKFFLRGGYVKTLFRRVRN